MRAQTDHDLLIPFLLPVAALACCVGLPLLLAVGSGALLWLLGLGWPVIALVLGAGLLFEARRRRRAASRRAAARRSAARHPTPAHR